MHRLSHEDTEKSNYDIDGTSNNDTSSEGKPRLTWPNDRILPNVARTLVFLKLFKTIEREEIFPKSIKPA